MFGFPAGVGGSISTLGMADVGRDGLLLPDSVDVKIGSGVTGFCTAVDLTG